MQAVSNTTSRNVERVIFSHYYYFAVFYLVTASITSPFSFIFDTKPFQIHRLSNQVSKIKAKAYFQQGFSFPILTVINFCVYYCLNCLSVIVLDISCSCKKSHSRNDFMLHHDRCFTANCMLEALMMLGKMLNSKRNF